MGLLGDIFGGIAKGIGGFFGALGDVADFVQLDEVGQWLKGVPGIGDVLGEIEKAIKKNPAAAVGILAFPYAPLAGALGVTFERRRDKGQSVDEAATGAVADTLGLAATAIGLILGGPAGASAGAGTAALLRKGADLASTAAAAEIGEATPEDLASSAAAFGKEMKESEQGQKVMRQIADRVETAKEGAENAAAAVEDEVNNLRAMGEAAARELVNDADANARKIGRAALGELDKVRGEAAGTWSEATGTAEEMAGGLFGFGEDVANEATSAIDQLGGLFGGMDNISELTGRSDSASRPRPRARDRKPASMGSFSASGEPPSDGGTIGPLSGTSTGF